MRQTRFLASLVLIVGLAVVAVPQAAVAQCNSPESPVYNQAITSPEQAIPGFGSQKASSQQLFDYTATVDAESDRVTSATFTTSVLGRPLSYALVSAPENLGNIAAIVGDNRALRDQRVTSEAEAVALAQDSPAIVWYNANVHGNEPSPGDAAIKILYELAARTDCEVETMLQNLVVGIIPTQNPDGRDANTRQNANGFDMNRDWFEWSQPETIGKIDLLTRYPGVLYIDAHEMFYNSFFFPPTADPTYHEISDTTMHWINDFYGPAMAGAFNERQQGGDFTFFNYSPYDFFAIVYGDTVPDTMFTGAGMTFEKGTQDQYSQRVLEHFVAGWASIEAASDHKEQILNELYGSYVTAIHEGANGELEPNSVNQPGSTVQREVPDIQIRSYFLGAGRAYAEVARIVGRLMKAGVEVYRLDAPLTVPHAHEYGRDATAATLPSGTYWVPMDQPQKHWIQAMLGEDTYVPFPYFYDVTAWSNPLLGDVDAWWTGDVLSPSATLVTTPPGGGIGGSGAGYLWFPGDSEWAVAGALELARGGTQVTRLTEASGGLPAGAFVAPSSAATDVSGVAAKFLLNVTAASGTPPSGVTFTQPKIALYAGGGESSRHLRFTLGKQWGVPFGLLSGSAINAGALTKGTLRGGERVHHLEPVLAGRPGGPRHDVPGGPRSHEPGHARRARLRLLVRAGRAADVPFDHGRQCRAISAVRTGLLRVGLRERCGDPPGNGSPGRREARCGACGALLGRTGLPGLYRRHRVPGGERDHLPTVGGPGIRGCDLERGGFGGGGGHGFGGAGDRSGPAHRHRGTDEPGQGGADSDRAVHHRRDGEARPQLRLPDHPEPGGIGRGAAPLRHPTAPVARKGRRGGPVRDLVAGADP